MPPPDEAFELRLVVGGKFGREGCKKQLAVAFPSVPLRQFDVAIAHDSVSAVDVAEIRAAYAVDDFRPSVRLYDAVEVKPLALVVAVGLANALGGERHARLVEEVVEPVVLPAESAVCDPTRRGRSSRRWGRRCRGCR